MIGQTGRIAPADKRIYALRDVTATVESIPLIVASILSKKLAEGIDALVLDVKVGRGAFMKTEAEARALAEALVRVGTAAGKRVVALLTDMSAPLGRTDRQRASRRARRSSSCTARARRICVECTLALGAEMLLVGNVAKDDAEARAKLRAAIASGDALRVIERMIAAQRGDARVAAHPELLPRAPEVVELRAEETGFVEGIDALDARPRRRLHGRRPHARGSGGGSRGRHRARRRARRPRRARAAARQDPRPHPRRGRRGRRARSLGLPSLPHPDRRGPPRARSDHRLTTVSLAVPSPRRNLTTLGYRRIVQLLVYLVIVPGVLLSAVGVLLLVMRRGALQSPDRHPGAHVLRDAGDGRHPGVGLPSPRAQPLRAPGRLRLQGVARAADAAHLDPHVHRDPEPAARRRGHRGSLHRRAQQGERAPPDADRSAPRLGPHGERAPRLRAREHEVRGIIDEAIAAFEPTRERRNVELTIEIAPDLPALLRQGRPGRLAREPALQRLQVRRTAAAHRDLGRPRTSAESAITVRDNGKGIARNEHKRIFEKFYRVDDLLARQQEGSGLGLAIVQHVMRAHRGRVEVDSEPGRGQRVHAAAPPTSPATVSRRERQRPSRDRA